MHNPDFEKRPGESDAERDMRVKKLTDNPPNPNLRQDGGAPASSPAAPTDPDPSKTVKQAPRTRDLQTGQR